MTNRSLAVEQAQVGRDHVAGREPHDVARHQRLDRNLDRTASSAGAGRAPHARGRLHHGAQPRRGLVGSVLLNEGGGDRQQDHQGNDDRRPDVAQEIGDPRQGQQQRVERISRAAPDFLQDRRLSLARDEVEPVRFEPALGFLRFKATGAQFDPLAAILRGQAAQGKQLLRIGARSRRHRLLQEA